MLHERRRFAIRLVIGGCALIMLSVAGSCPASAQGRGLELRNVAQSEANGKSWKWTAFIAGPPDKLTNIACVEYTLHPTFPNPVRKVCNTTNPRYPFGLEAVGWGTFNIHAKVEFKDG